MKKPRLWPPVFLAVVTMAAFPGTPPVNGVSPPDFSVKALCARIDRQIAALGGIVMQEEISRYDSARGRTGKVDEYRASVEITDGVDSFARLRRNGRPCPAAAQIRGAWSFGEFSTVLRISRDALDSQPVKLNMASDSEPPALVAVFHYPASSARWFVDVGSRVYWLDFQGEIRVSAITGDVLRISWKSAPPAPEAGIEEIRRIVSFAPREVGGETCNLPESAEYRVVHSGDRVEWNTARFTDPARYSSSVSLKYGE